MEGILPELRLRDKERVFKELRVCTDARQRTRLLVIVNLMNRRSAVITAAALQVHRATVYRVAERFRDYSLPGLSDGRRHNGRRKITDKYLAVLCRAVGSSPLEYGWQRPTWTRELLVATLLEKTRVKIHVATMSIALRRIRARRGRPKPTVHCPWPESRRRRRICEIRRLIARLPATEAAVYEDEVDIHLNPKIGCDWMLRGQQKQVLTPGKNVKRYLAGAVDARTHRLIWVEGERKTAELFVKLLWKLVRHYRNVKVIHVVLDNYKIHSSTLVAMSLRSAAGKIRLHFLPPYCPDDNPIERDWKDLHDHVTRNHRCPTIEQLLENVHHYIVQRNRSALRQSLAA
jgi:transposase